MAPLLRTAVLALLSLTCVTSAATLPNVFLGLSPHGARKALKKAGVIPDVIDSFRPHTLLEANYNPPNTSSTPISYGNTIPLSAVPSPPAVYIRTGHHADDSPLTLVITDPDAPTRSNATNAQICHWIITGLTLSGTTTVTPKTLIEYMPPKPPQGSGKHRYVLVLLTHEKKADADKEIKPPSARPKWGYDKPGSGVREWARDNGLKVIAANFFYAENKTESATTTARSLEELRV